MTEKKSCSSSTKKTKESSKRLQSLGLETQLIHGGLKYRGETGAVIPPLFQTSTFECGNPGGFDYTRSGNPNFENLEAVLCQLEQAKYATVFSSGVAAITAVVSSLSSGDLILAEENLYGCTFRLFEQVFKKFNLEVQYLDFTKTENLEQIVDRKPKLVWIESPTNPLLKIIDIEKAAYWTHQAEAELLVDNTFASSYFQKPLSLGADLSLASTTKYLNGHSDCLGGVVCCNSEAWQQRMIFAQKALGLNPSPFDTWLTSRGVKTLAVRMKQHHENALAFAEYFQNHPRARSIRFPLLPSHPQFETAKRQMSGGSGIVSMELSLDLAQTMDFLKRLKLFTLAESLGGIESLVCHPASMTHASVPKDVREKVGISDSLVRFSVGIENIKDLIRDVEGAFPGKS